MPGTRCAVFGCNNAFYTKTKKTIGQNLIFHVFPKSKDLVSQTTRGEWISRCKRQDKFNPDTSRICSVHFVESDYERDLRNELLGLPLKKTLKKTAVPTVGINNVTNINSARSDRPSTRKRKQEVAKVVTTVSVLDASDNLEIESPTTSAANFVEKSRQDMMCKEEYKELVEKYSTLKEICGKKIKVLNNQLKYYKAKMSYARAARSRHTTQKRK